MQKKLIILASAVFLASFSLASANLESPQPNAGKVEDGVWTPASNN